MDSPQLSENLGQAKLGQVRKWVWILEIWSENGCGKWHFFGLQKRQDSENRAPHPHQEFPVVPPSGDQERGVNHVIIIIA